ncbi:glycosyltransferase [Desulfospira joergensenii]|uniref:glycosyltransferase n=1 Tax=Desulfospira joergensenii TaxID=53329 RepID=UPI0003B2E675|nr:glycosyltransferase [Desulfospira joergensenii]
MEKMKTDKRDFFTSLALVENFFILSDSGRLFDPSKAQYYKELRYELKKALVTLLFWCRPQLEESRGILWVYEGFNRRAERFEKTAIEKSYSGQGSVLSQEPADSPTFAAMQAMLFLGLLPFPGQWKWLELLCENFSEDPEVQSFLENEKDIIHRKLVKKDLLKLKLRSFSQVLKAPEPPGEKGVLRIFSMPYLFFFCPGLLKELSRDYFIYVEPAAGINFRHSWMRIYSGLEDPVLFGAASREDADFLGSQSGIMTTHLAHGDYLETDAGNADDSGVRGKDKNYDIVFNNTFDEMDRKRHEFMLDLMSHPLLEKAKVLFLGQGKERNIRCLRQDIQQRGLQKRAVVVANILRREVPAYLRQCRLGVHLALQENGCRAVYEYFRSDLPCVMSTATAGMNMDIINPRTGMAAPDKDMAPAVSEVLANIDQYDPRAWFLENSGSINSTKALNTRLKKIFLNLGYEWHKDIVSLTGSGPGRYADKSDMEKFNPQIEEISRGVLSKLKTQIRDGQEIHGGK